MDAQLAVLIGGADLGSLVARLTGEREDLTVAAVDQVAGELDSLVVAAQVEFLRAAGVDAALGEHTRLGVPCPVSPVQEFGPFQPVAVDSGTGPVLCVLLCDAEFPTGVAAASDGSPLDAAHAERARVAVCEALGVPGVLDVLPSASSR